MWDIIHLKYGDPQCFTGFFLPPLNKEGSNKRLMGQVEIPDHCRNENFLLSIILKIPRIFLIDCKLLLFTNYTLKIKLTRNGPYDCTKYKIIIQIIFFWYFHLGKNGKGFEGRKFRPSSARCWKHQRSPRNERYLCHTAHGYNNQTAFHW